jgi:hypothetical protein
MEQFDYFMIRVRRAAPDGTDEPLSGVAERLGTGDKWRFDSGEELLHIVAHRSPRSINMQLFQEPDNETAW